MPIWKNSWEIHHANQINKWMLLKMPLHLHKIKTKIGELKGYCERLLKQSVQYYINPVWQVLISRIITCHIGFVTVISVAEMLISSTCNLQSLMWSPARICSDIESAKNVQECAVIKCKRGSRMCSGKVAERFKNVQKSLKCKHLPGSSPIFLNEG